MEQLATRCHCIDETANLAVTNSTFNGNSAQIGGAIYINNNAGTLSLTNNTIAATRPALPAAESLWLAVH